MKWVSVVRSYDVSHVGGFLFVYEGTECDDRFEFGYGYFVVELVFNFDFFALYLVCLPKSGICFDNDGFVAICSVGEGVL